VTQAGPVGAIKKVAMDQVCTTTPTFSPLPYLPTHELNKYWASGIIDQGFTATLVSYGPTLLI